MPAEGPPARANPARGLALIATALILGIFVLRQGFSTDGPSADAVGSQVEQEDDQAPAGEEDDAGEATGEDDAPETPEPLSPAELTVRVANTTGVGGAAGGWSDRIEQEGGYQIAPAADAEERDLATTAIIHREGLEQEASELAGAIGDAAQIELRPIPEQPPLSRSGDPLLTEDVDLVVLLGADLASQAG